MTKKDCTTCKFEPEWVPFYGSIVECYAGKCKYPLPPTLTPLVCKNKNHITLKDSDGSYCFKMANGCTCYAWAAK